MLGMSCADVTAACVHGGGFAPDPAMPSRQPRGALIDPDLPFCDPHGDGDSIQPALHRSQAPVKRLQTCIEILSDQDRQALLYLLLSAFESGELTPEVTLDTAREQPHQERQATDDGQGLQDGHSFCTHGSTHPSIKPTRSASESVGDPVGRPPVPGPGLRLTRWIRSACSKKTTVTFDDIQHPITSRLRNL